MLHSLYSLLLDNAGIVISLGFAFTLQSVTCQGRYSSISGVLHSHYSLLLDKAGIAISLGFAFTLQSVIVKAGITISLGCCIHSTVCSTNHELVQECL